MEVIDNINRTVRDDLEKEIKKGSRVSIAASCFSIYAYKELQKQLNNIEELRFIYTSPTFVNEGSKKEKREFYIPRLTRERSLYGTEFEVRLRNELSQKAVAQECAEWIRKKASFYSNTTGEFMQGFLTIENKDETLVYQPFNEFTTIGLGCERGNNAYNWVNRMESPYSTQYLKLFDQLWNDKSRLQDVTDVVIDSISVAYKENAPDFIYFFTIYNILHEFLDDISEDVIPNEDTGFKNSRIWNTLYDFQKDAAIAIINKLETYNGCILADSVGLGKTYTALAVIKYYECRNKSVLVLCPKKLSDNWTSVKQNYEGNALYSDRFRYDVLYHTDLSRDYGYSNGIDLGRLNWGNYDLVVIDESHNFRNGYGTHANTSENRYERLMEKVIKAGVRTKVLMLSATPVNNRFLDLKNQLALAYEGDPEQINSKLNTKKSIDEIFRQAQSAYTAWCKLPVEQRTTDTLMKMLDYDFFELLDSVTIARSRKHIQKYYNMSAIGTFPERLKPISKYPCLTDLDQAINYNQIYETLMSLNLSIYTPSAFILPSRLDKYMDLSQNQGKNLTQRGREQGIRHLMSVNLLKRLESSVHSFKLTIDRIRKYIDHTIQTINAYQSGNHVMELEEIPESGDFDLDDQESEYFTVGKKVRIDLVDMDYLSWLRDLEQDSETLELLSLMVADITPEHDTKLQTLFAQIREKEEHPVNPKNHKILIFTAFSDTADYLYEHVSRYAKDMFGLDTAEITGSVEGKSTIPGLRCEMNSVLSSFSPVSKGLKNCSRELDILIATDCISEGQNLQDCDYVINYDIHWNPVRIIQRFGRIDRIGSKNRYIQLVNFWPDMDLDEYIQLKSRVETRMKITVMTSTGDDDLINEEEKGDLEYRKQQLKRLQEEVVDIEDMSGGVSITDLGLNEFRMDLLEYMKHNDDVEHSPYGMHAVVSGSEDCPPGVMFILRNISNEINIDNQNRLHPFYMVYISNEGEIICDYLSSKDLLDKMRLLCKGKSEPDKVLCKNFNHETNDGKNMLFYSELLSDAINSILDVKEESDIDSLFRAGGTSALLSKVNGIDDFELICFLVVK